MDEVIESKNWIARSILFPGNWVVDHYKVKEPDNRLLIRMYVNLLVYAKIFGTMAYLWVL